MIKSFKKILIFVKVETAIENYRIRKCAIYYYLEDGTIHVTEPRVENSGLPQGLFIKRQKIPKQLGEVGEYYGWEDFNVGINVNFFERVFRIVGSDDFTRVIFFIELFLIRLYRNSMRKLGFHLIYLKTLQLIILTYKKR